MSEKQFVVFTLGSEHYGFDILNIQEITRYEHPTPIPDMPSYMEGVINLRGNIIPVFSLGRKFGLSGSQITGESRIIVLNVAGKKTGVLVDAVSQVEKINEEEIESPDGTNIPCGQKGIVGLAKKEGKIIVLLEPNALFGDGFKA